LKPIAKLAAMLAMAFVAAPAPAGPRPQPVELWAEVQAPPPAVWRALTTPDGVETFFARQYRVEPEIGGAYEMYFLLDNPPGLRGGEGVRILAMEEPRRFVISWNAPPNFGPLRQQQTVVEFELEPLGQDRTLVQLTHHGWGRGSDWQGVRDYFADAWKIILGRLQFRFDRGPVDWTRPPDGAAYFRPYNWPDGARAKARGPIPFRRGLPFAYS
jgi:uncharacterized protein YndB with AHSA1/START domain